MTSFRFFLALGLACLLSACASHGPRHSPYVHEGSYDHPIRVACVGDSITYGHGIKDREHDSYPAQLGRLLGQKWTVQNYGVSGATLIKKGMRPYWTQKEYQDALASQPDVVIIKLGTNDTHEKNWTGHEGDFTPDYLEMIHSFKKLSSKPRIYLCLPVPLFRDRGKARDTDKILVQEIIPQIEKVALRENLPVIDLYAALDGHADLCPDGVHPNAVGAGIMAHTISDALVGPPSSGKIDRTHRRKHVRYSSDPFSDLVQNALYLSSFL